MEVFWTGMGSALHKDKKLTSNTSIWMFPIYGMAAVIGPLSKKMKNRNMALRGLLYMNGIFSMEYLTGTLLKKKNMCPWDYSNAPFNFRGVIRLDYAPVWFVTGLFFEKVLKQ